MLRFLGERIGDQRLIRLIGKWLRMGAMEDGQLVDTGKGTPQGSVISPVLANIYLHYVLDLWVGRKWRPQEARGAMIFVRYADDYVRRGKAFSSSGCEPRATTVASVGSSQGGSWRQRNGLKHSGVKGPR